MQMLAFLPGQENMIISFHFCHLYTGHRLSSVSTIKYCPYVFNRPYITLQSIMLFKGIVKWKAPPAGLTNTSSSSNLVFPGVSHPGTDQLNPA